MDDNKKREGFDKELDEFLNFINAAAEACNNSNGADFTCPICGGSAHAVKSRLNGHIHAGCDGCGMLAMT